MSKDGSTSFHGISNITFGILDDEGKLLTGEKGLSESGVLLVDGDGQGATEANITGLEEAGTIQQANNKSKRISHGKPQPQVAITMLDMPYKALQILKGYEMTETGAWIKSSGNKPHVAMLIHTTGFDGSDMYEAFANGELIEPGHNHGTDTNTEVDANTVLTYQALTPIDPNVFINKDGEQQIYGMYVDNADTGTFKKEDMLKEVFGGFAGTLDLNTGVSTPAHTTASLKTK